MGSSVCKLAVVLIILCVALACIVIALVTDYWYDVSTDALSPTLQKTDNYRYGLWRRCYDSIPDSYISDPDIDRSGGNCIWTFRDLIPDDFDSLTTDEKRVIHLGRTSIGCSIAACALIIGALIILVCGSIPGDCAKVQRSSLYISTAFIVLFAALTAIASGISFIAARDIDEESNQNYKYLWSFMLHWIGTGFCMVAGFLILWILKDTSNDVNDNMKYYYDM